jgi:primosomal protein N' (replication factor Y)
VTLGLAGSGGYAGELREINSVIDREPILPPYVMPLVRWLSEMYLCGIGTAMKTLLPANFLKGELLPQPGDAACEPRDIEPTDTFIYEPVDAVRLERYAELCSDGRPTLICFPLYEAAKDFAERLGETAILYPRSGAKAEWQTWGRLLASGIEQDEYGKMKKKANVLVGGQTAASAPFPGVSRIIVEDECNNAWRTIRPPLFNVRSLLAKRARIERASLVLGGRMPSSRVYMTIAKDANPAKLAKTGQNAQGVINAQKPAKKHKNFCFVDLKLAYSPSVKGVQDALAVSEPLVRESESAITRGSWALWILDRKGYAGEIVCDECGASLRCARCGGAMRWEVSAERIVCVSCGTSRGVPDSCPGCAGKLLMAKRPGLEALLPLAKSAINSPVPILDIKDAAGPDLAEPSGLVVGTRAALALCDILQVGMVGWIDVDGEARSQEYDARSRAFGLVWESRWRGKLPEERRVVLQTRRAAREWQKGFDIDSLDKPGWTVFWRSELRERREFSMPPFTPLVRIDTKAADANAMAEMFDDARFEYWISDTESPEEPSVPEGAKKRPHTTIWLRTKDIGLLRKTLAPFFSIKRARAGFPSVIVRYE